MDYIVIRKDDELMHYGVKGMKWGVRNRREMTVAKKYARAGRTKGAADYYRSEGAKAYKKHNESAKVLDKMAKKHEAEGSYIKADLARRSASALRARGANIKASNDAKANAYMKKAEKLTEKANVFASKKKVDLGKKTLNNILKDSSKKGHDRAKSANDYEREVEARRVLGDNGYDAYNRLAGRDS